VHVGAAVKIVVWLGNPGTQYEKTRHNIGWMVLDRVADRAGWSGRGRTRDAAAVTQGRYNGLDLTLVKPLTFMNESGLAVRKVLARERAPLTEMLVVTDDFALPFGKLRFREGGSAGGHNGLKSIIGELGNEQFSRLRIGIGEPGRDAIDHVLSQFNKSEKARMSELLDAAADAVEAWARDGTSKAAGRFNSFELRPADEERAAAPGEVEGPPGADGIRRTKTGWRKPRPPEAGE
jgi:PTH1 family peptidyl-tRNA hydrolase